jgi:hypothetical protein
MPKCGTTALYEYLRTHPNVFLPSVKEPLYFCDCVPDPRPATTIEQYEALYAGASIDHRRVGDASPWYLPWAPALPRIRETLGSPRVMVMLRPPDAFLRSLHSDLVWVCAEDQIDFDMAWRLQEPRRRGERLPKLCRAPWVLQYRELARFGAHLRRWQDVFPREQIKVVLLEDLQAAPQRVYEEVLTFLDLPPDGRTEFPRVNAGKQSRWPALAQWKEALYQRLPPPMLACGRRLGLRAANRLITRLNTRPRSPAPLSPALRKEILSDLSSDIDELGALIGRNLNHWK